MAVIENHVIILISSVSASRVHKSIINSSFISSLSNSIMSDRRRCTLSSHARCMCMGVARLSGYHPSSLDDRTLEQPTKNSYTKKRLLGLYSVVDVSIVLKRSFNMMRANYLVLYAWYSALITKRSDAYLFTRKCLLQRQCKAHIRCCLLVTVIH